MRMNPDSDTTQINEELEHIDALACYFTERDEVFMAAMKEIQAGRKFRPGQDSEEDYWFRNKQFREIIKAGCRNGVLTRSESPESTWEAS